MKFFIFFSLVFSSCQVMVFSEEGERKFYKGTDISWFSQMEKGGFIFYDYDGNRKDLLLILKENGINLIRLRTWVEPSDDPVNGHCSMEETIDMAKRVKGYGFVVMIDFHYSDSWADPSKQHKPKRWEGLSFSELKEAVYEYTYTFMTNLISNGVYPEFVQIGNEINSGILWPDGSYTNFRNLAELLDAGVKAVRRVSPNTKIVIHLAEGHNNSVFRWFFDNLHRYFYDYDVIGMSYYPYWAGGSWEYSIKLLISNIQDMVSRYGKEVMIVETGHFWYEEDETYNMLITLIREVRGISKGLGVIYWEPQGAEVWSGYSMSCWGNDGKPTKALKAFRD